MKFMKAGTLFVVFSLLISLPAFGLDFKPGKYEITSQVEMEGMPGAMPPQTTTQCLTKSEPVPNGSAAAQGCKITDMNTKGNKVTYTMECDQQGMKVTSTGEIIYKGDSFKGTSTMEMGPSAGGMTITTQTTGKWVGKCDN
ncbi:MAG: DUF3617 family protein [Desulfobacteraceae bacterium]|jgi:hypothetical protein